MFHSGRVNIFAASIALGFACCLEGCTDQDRELAKKSGDGTETFRYQPPVENGAQDERSAPSKPKTETQGRPSDTSKPAVGATKEIGKGTVTRAHPGLKESPDGAFKYTPDPKLLKQMSRTKEH
jgi:hypothetical protein